MKLKNYLFLPLILGLASCAGSKYMESFQDMDKSTVAIPMKELPESHKVRYQPEDRLSIVISSIDPNASAMFNLPTTNFMRPGETVEMTTTQTLQTYLVDADGNINYPVLGTLHVEGLTSDELKKMLYEKLTSYFTQPPVIDIQLTNFTVYVSGEVKKPGKILVNKENITLMEAIITAEDVSLGGRKDKVTLVRRTDDTNEIYHFDLTKSETLALQNFYLKQTDMIYIPPTEFIKRNADENRQMLTIVLPVVSTFISALSVVLVAVLK